MSSKRRITFGMVWQVAGTQTIEIPDELDVTDRNAVTAYLKENWETIPVPVDGEYIPDSDTLDDLRAIEVIEEE